MRGKENFSFPSITIQLGESMLSYVMREPKSKTSSHAWCVLFSIDCDAREYVSHAVVCYAIVMWKETKAYKIKKLLCVVLICLRDAKHPKANPVDDNYDAEAEGWVKIKMFKARWWSWRIFLPCKRKSWCWIIEQDVEQINMQPSLWYLAADCLAKAAARYCMRVFACDVSHAMR